MKTMKVSDHIKDKIFKHIEEQAPLSTGDVQGIQTGLDPTCDGKCDKANKKKKKGKVVRRPKNKSIKI